MKIENVTIVLKPRKDSQLEDIVRTFTIYELFAFIKSSKDMADVDSMYLEYSHAKFRASKLIGEMNEGLGKVQK